MTGTAVLEKEGLTTVLDKVASNPSQKHVSKQSFTETLFQVQLGSSILNCIPT